MWPYLVAYELADRASSEDRLVECLSELSGRRLMHRLWLVVLDQGAAHILERLAPCLTPADQIMVLELAEDNASLNMKAELSY